MIAIKRLCPIALLFLLFACQRTQQVPETKPTDISIKWNVNPIDRINVQLLRITSQYLDSINRNKKDSLKACRLFVEQKNTSILYKLSPVTHFSSVKDDLPCGYVEFKDKAILVYTGIEKLFEKENVLPVDLANLLEGKLINDLLPDLKTVNPKINHDVYSFPTWELTISNDSLKIINRNAERVWRVKTKIFSLPNSLK